LELFHEEKHPSIMSCEEVYTRQYNNDGISEIRIMMIFPVAEKSLYDWYLDKETKISEDQVLTILE
jgi:hypothetical protein